MHPWPCKSYLNLTFFVELINDVILDNLQTSTLSSTSEPPVYSVHWETKEKSFVPFYRRESFLRLGEK